MKRKLLSFRCMPVFGAHIAADRLRGFDVSALVSPSDMLLYEKGEAFSLWETAAAFLSEKRRNGRTGLRTRAEGGGRRIGKTRFQKRDRKKVARLRMASRTKTRDGNAERLRCVYRPAEACGRVQPRNSEEDGSQKSFRMPEKSEAVCLTEERVQREGIYRTLQRSRQKCRELNPGRQNRGTRSKKTDRKCGGRLSGTEKGPFYTGVGE